MSAGRQYFVSKSTFIALSVLLAWTSPAFGDITGKPRVIDGDTIEVAGQRMRLHADFNTMIDTSFMAA